MKKLPLVLLLLALFAARPAPAVASPYSPTLSANCGVVGVQWSNPLPYTRFNGGDAFVLVQRKDMEPQLLKLDYAGFTGRAEYWQARVPYAPGEKVVLSAYIETEWEYWLMGSAAMGCGVWMPAVSR